MLKAAAVVGVTAAFSLRLLLQLVLATDPGTKPGPAEPHAALAADLGSRRGAPASAAGGAQRGGGAEEGNGEGDEGGKEEGLEGQVERGVAEMLRQGYFALQPTAKAAANAADAGEGGGPNAGSDALGEGGGVLGEVLV